jgi:hypothetical protein
MLILYYLNGQIIWDKRNSHGLYSKMEVVSSNAFVENNVRTLPLSLGSLWYLFIRFLTNISSIELSCGTPHEEVYYVYKNLSLLFTISFNSSIEFNQLLIKEKNMLSHLLDWPLHSFFFSVFYCINWGIDLSYLSKTSKIHSHTNFLPVAIFTPCKHFGYLKIFKMEDIMDFCLWKYKFTHFD